MTEVAVPPDPSDARPPSDVALPTRAAVPTPKAPVDEIRDLIAASEGRLGDVYRLTEEGLEPEQIAERLNVATFNFVYSYRRYIDSALHGTPVAGAVMRRQTTSALNSLMKRGRPVLSPEALRLLQANKAAVEAAGAATDAAEEAEAAAQDESEATMTMEGLKGVAGIYAFSYGWYLESPVDAERGFTLIKVGRAADIAQRIQTHTTGARTHMPEPLVLIRAYETGALDPSFVEKRFHKLLETAGHDNPRRSGASSREVGKEWFLTTEDFLDEVAETLSLRTLYIGQSEFADG